MKYKKRFASILLSILLCCSCFFFTSCANLADKSTVGTYHLIQMSYEEDNKTVTVNLNIFTNFLMGYSMKLVLNADNTAQLIENREGVEVVSRGSWAEMENGDVELLFNDYLSIATRTGTTLTIKDETSTMVFQKFFLNI